MKAFKVIKYVLVIIGLSLLLVSYREYNKTSIFMKSAVSTQGKVIEMERSRSRSSGNDYSYIYKPVVRFQAKDGTQIEFVSPSGSSTPSHYVGEIIDILYNQNSPNEAKIKSFSAIWGGALTLGIIGFVLFFIGSTFIVLHTKKKNTIEYLKRNGSTIKADFKHVGINERYKVNGRSPYQIITQWQDPITSVVHIFKSDDIWYDPTEYIKDDKISILIDRQNPKRYSVDISFLPPKA